jgi:glycerol transport system ATP-binding protein
VPATLTQLQDVGTHLMLSAQVDGSALKARLASEAVVPAPGATVWLKVLGAKSCFYRDEELVA